MARRQPERSDPVLEGVYIELSDRFAPLGMPEPVYLQAVRLSSFFGLKTPEALHLACAQHHDCDALWTKDDRLAQASHGLAVNVLR